MPRHRFLGWGMYTLLCILIVGCLSACTREGRKTSEDDLDTLFAFVNVNVVPMTSERIDYDQVVLVRGDRIEAIGPLNSIEIPSNARVIDGEGGFLMPGLADMHMHTNQNWDTVEWPVSPLMLYLANGVTTIRHFGSTGDELIYVLKWRDEIRGSARTGPSIYASGKILFASPLGDPVGMVKDNARLGFDFLKLYSYLSPEDTQLALATAKDLNFYSAGHIPYTVGLEHTLDFGMDEIAHVEELAFEFIEFDRDQSLSPDAWLGVLMQAAVNQFGLDHGFDEAVVDTQLGETLEAVISLLKQYNTPVCTTLVIDKVIQEKLFDLTGFLERPESAYLPAAYLESLRSQTEKHQIQFRGLESLARYKSDLDLWLLRKLHESGVLLLSGTDSGILAIVPGYSIHDELQILVENGFSPYEAIATSTLNAAEVVEEMIGCGDFGRIEVGLRADLLLMPDNPLEDVGAIQDLQGVMAAGRWYSRAELDRMTRVD